MGKQAQKKFYWILKNFSSLQSERRYSVPVQIGDCKWRLLVDPKGRHNSYLSLEVVKFESLPCRWKRYVKLRLTIVNHHSDTLSITEEIECCFDDKCTTWGITSLYPLYRLEDKDSGFLKNREVTIFAEVDVFEVADISSETEILEEASEFLNKKKGNDGTESDDLLKKTSPVKESNDVNGTKQEFFITSMEQQVGKRFAWVIKDFSSLQCDKCYSVPVLIGDCKWRLFAYPKGDNVKYLSLFLEVVDSEILLSGWSKYVKIRLTIVKQVSEEPSVIKETHRWFDQKHLTWGFHAMLSLTQLHDEKEKFLVNGELMIVADVEVLQVTGTVDETEEASESLNKMKLDDGAKACDLLNQTQLVKESIDVNGFQVLPSQVEYVSRIFEKHPDIAVEFRAKNQHLRKALMHFLLSLIETLCQSLYELSNEDIVEADIALSYLKDAGFKVDWLEKKLEEVKEKKEKEQSGLAQLKELEDNLLELKQKCSDLNALVEKKKTELSTTRTPLSFNDVV